MASKKYTLQEGEALVNIIAEKYLANLTEDRKLHENARELDRQRNYCKANRKWWQCPFRRCPDETDGIYKDIRALEEARETMALEVINIILDTEYCGCLYDGFWPDKLAFVEAYSEEFYAYREPNEYVGEDDAVGIMDYDMSKSLSEQVLKALDADLYSSQEKAKRLESSLESTREHINYLEGALRDVRQKLNKPA